MTTSNHKKGREQLFSVKSNLLMMVIGILIACDIHFDDTKSYAEFGSDIADLMLSTHTSERVDELYQLLLCREDDPVGFADVKAAVKATKMLQNLTY